MEKIKAEKIASIKAEIAEKGEGNWSASVYEDGQVVAAANGLSRISAGMNLEHKLARMRRSLQECINNTPKPEFEHRRKKQKDLLEDSPR